MKRLLAAVFTVGALTACGSTSAPKTPVDTGPIYPSVAGTWSDSEGTITACGNSAPTKMVINIVQNEEVLNGRFEFRRADGEMAGDVFAGKVNTTGRITGQLSSGEGAFDIDMDANSTSISGKLTSASIFQCENGDMSRITMAVRLERE